MVLELSMFHTCAIAVIVLIIGRIVRDNVHIIDKYCIPVPVVGGLILTLLILLGYTTGLVEINFDFVLSDFFMLAFYSSIGFTASIKVLKRGGKKYLNT